MPEAGGPSRILLADPDRECRELCAAVGRRLGLHCLEAEHGRQALALASQEGCELVLIDLLLDDMTGMELLEAIRCLRPRTAMVLMSAHASVESAVEAMRLGAVDVLVKPFGPEKLESVLRGMLAHAQRPVEPSVAAQPMPGCTDLEQVERLTMQRVFDLVRGDKQQAQKLLGISRATLYRKLKRYGIAVSGEPPEKIAGEPQKQFWLSQG